MSFPSSNTQDPSSFSSPTSSGARGTRSQQFAWSSSNQRQPPRRGLTPISTGSSAQTRPTSASDSPSRHTFSPTSYSFNHAATTANRHVASRQSSASSANSLTSPSGTGPQQPTSQLLSRDRRTTNSSGSPHLASSVASLSSASQTGGPGGGTTSRLARHSPSLSLSTTGSPVSSTGPHSAGGSSSQLTSLVITQLNILLSTIKEDKDRTKWEAQAVKIGKVSRPYVRTRDIEANATLAARRCKRHGSLHTIFPALASEQCVDNLSQPGASDGEFWLLPTPRVRDAEATSGTAAGR